MEANPRSNVLISNGKPPRRLEAVIAANRGPNPY
jgi:hypothetical protein